MAIFSTKQTQTTTIPKAGAQEKATLDFLMQLAQTAGGQVGDLGDLASGNIPSLSPEMQAVIQDLANTMLDRESRAINDQYTEGLRGARDQAALQGQTDDSIENVYRAIVGRERQSQFGDLNNRISEFVNQMSLQLPFQVAGLQQDANSLLYNMAISGANAVQNNLLSSRMAQPTTTVQGNGGLLGLIPLASKLMGSGNFDLAGLLGIGGKDNTSTGAGSTDFVDQLPMKRG